MSENTPEEIIENIQAPFVKLTAPQLPEITESSQTTETPDTSETIEAPETVNAWLVVAKNRRVNRDWEALIQRHPENASRCYQDLRTAPVTRQPGRVFPLKGKKYVEHYATQPKTHSFCY